MEFSQIVYEKLDRVAMVTMSRPEKLNAWTPRMGAEIQAAMMDAEHDNEVRVIIVTGAGKAYCAGADMKALSEVAEGRASVGGSAPADDWLKRQRPDYRSRYSWPLALSKPVIGAINGVCVGLGFTTCLYHDIRIASERARMGLIFVRRGLAIEHGNSWMLSRIIGLANAVELAVTGRLVKADEALRMGLVNMVVPHERLIEVARELAGEIAANCSPLGVSEAKKMVYRHLFTDLATAVTEDETVAEMMVRSEDFREGIRAFVEKRPARFSCRRPVQRP